MQTKFEIAAKEAISYARSYIVNGNTWLSSNGLDADSKRVLNTGVGFVREEKNSLLHSSKNPVDNFFSVVTTSKKYSLGNCHELAFMALHYLVSKYPDYRSEVVSLGQGNHVFVVIGRDENSEIGNINTWGKDAIICDPWANKIFPASEYLTELKGYKLESQGTFGNKILVNTVQNYNPQLFIPETENLPNSELVKQNNAAFESIIEEFKSKLVNITNELKNTEGEKSEKILIINKFIDRLSQARDEQLKNLLDVDFTSERASNIKTFKAIQGLFSLNAEEKSTLRRHHFFQEMPSLNPIIQQIGNLFNSFLEIPEATKKLDLAFNDFQTKLADYLKPKPEIEKEQEAVFKS
jgi:hypothetical protein